MERNMTLKRTVMMMGAALLLGSAAAMAQVVPAEPINEGTTPGLVMAGSSSAADLPQPALKFINHYFKGLDISKVERQYAKGLYDVDFANGLEIEFNNQGKVMEIDAPDGMALAPSVVRALMSHKAYENLKRNGSVKFINSIDLTYNRGKLVKVETVAAAPQDIVMDFNGNIVLVEEDD